MRVHGRERGRAGQGRDQGGGLAAGLWRDRQQHLARVPGGSAGQAGVGPVALSRDAARPCSRRWPRRSTPSSRTAATRTTAMWTRPWQAAGAQVIEAEYRVPYLSHSPLEPMTAVVQLKDGVLDIWTGTQIPRFLVDGVAGVTGIAAKNIRLHVHDHGRQLRPPAGRRLREAGRAAGAGPPRRADQADLDARRRHDARLPAPAGHRPVARCGGQPAGADDGSGHRQPLGHGLADGPPGLPRRRARRGHRGRRLGPAVRHSQLPRHRLQGARLRCR